MIPIRPAGGRSPSVLLPLAYLGTAAAAFVLAALALPWMASDLAGHYYHPHVLALTHTVALGWISLAIMGASYQLLSIVLECPIWSVRLARWQLPVLASGIAGMVGHFWIGQWSGLAWAAGVVALGVAGHVLNIGLSVRGLTRWTFTARCFVLALLGLGLTAALGLTLAANRLWGFLPETVFPTLHAHLHLALLGWIAPMVLGVAARVYPMFLLAREPGGPVAAIQLWGLRLGVPGVALGLLVAPWLVVPSALAVAGALAAHGAWIVGAVRNRKRPALDWGLRFVLTGAAFLVPGTALGLGLALGILSGPRVGLAYAAIALGGWVSLTIVGMMLKIIPFLVWYRVYGPQVGRVAVPTLAQLSWHGGEVAAYVCLVGGTAGLAVALVTGQPAAIAGAGSVISVGALALVGVLARVLVHLGRKPAPATSPPSGAPRARADRVPVP
jgi:hypothetical protein